MATILYSHKIMIKYILYISKKRGGFLPEFVNTLREFSLLTVVVRLLLALLLGGLVGLERERSRQAAGLRTHILVCTAATMTMLIGIFATEVMDFSTDPLRIAAQVVSGIGFIGAGAIMVRSGRHIKGITTASGLWCTAAIGLAVGAGFYEGAIICSIIVLIVMSLLKKLDKSLLFKNTDSYIYFEIKGSDNVNQVFEDLRALSLDLTLNEILPPKSGTSGNVGVIIKLNNPVNDIRKVSNAISKIENVSFSIPDRGTSDTI